MLEKRVELSGRMLIWCGLFSLFGLIILYGIFIIFTQQIYMEDNTPMPQYFKIIFAVVAGVVELGIIYMVFPLWKRIIKKTGAMPLTHRGIENTFALFNLFAFWTILKINYIPWNALVLDEKDEIITIDLELLPKEACGKLARLLLLGGFNYSIGKINFKEIKSYRDSALEIYQV